MEIGRRSFLLKTPLLAALPVHLGQRTLVSRLWASFTATGGEGLLLGPGEYVSFEAIGNFSFSQGNIELSLQPRWDSRVSGEVLILGAGSKNSIIRIRFREGRFRLDMGGGVASVGPGVPFAANDRLYLVAKYDYSAHSFCLLVNGEPGSPDTAHHELPGGDWGGNPFKIHIGPQSGAPSDSGFTLSRLRTSSRPLSSAEIRANAESVRAQRDLQPDHDTLLEARFDGGTRMTKGYGGIGVAGGETESPASPTALPELDSVLGPESDHDSWLLSDASWKVHAGILPGDHWKDDEFDDHSWNSGVVKITEAERRLGTIYRYNSKPHHLSSSAAEWISFTAGREGLLRRTFTLTSADLRMLEDHPGTLYVTSADKFDCFVNGRWIGTSGGHFRPGYGEAHEATTYWQIPQTFEIASLVHEGSNTIAVRLSHDPRISSDEREGLFLDWRKGRFESIRFDWSSVPGETIMRPATLDLREVALRSLEYHLNTDFKSVLVEKGGIFYGWSYGDTLGRSLDAIVLLRSMTGVDRFPDADRRLLEAALQTFTGDGMSYRELAPHVAPELEIPGSMPYAMMWDQVEILFGLVTWYEKTQSAIIRDYIEGMIAGLTRAAVRVGDAYHLPEEFWDGRQWVSTDLWFNPGAVLLDPIAHYYEISHSPAAYELLRGLYRSQKEHLGHDGREEAYFEEAIRLKTQRISSEGEDSQNFGAGISLGWTGALRAALVFDDKEMVEWIQRALDWSFGIAATHYGHALENLGLLPGEICGVCDLVELASMLAEHVDSRYWGLVERFIRNHIVQTQNPESGMWGRVTPEGEMSSPLPCCSSRGARAIYIAWHHTIRSKPEGIFVNLPLNRDSHWLEVASYLPYEGRIDLTIHDAPIVFVRIPEWAPHEQVKVESAGTKVGVAGWKGEYARLEGLRPGQQISIRFPIAESKTTEELRMKPDAAPLRYQASWRGYTLIHLAPNGKYDRRAMTASAPAVRPVKSYFVPDAEITG